MFDKLYSIGIRIYYLLILAASLFQKKARLWVKGRRSQNLKELISVDASSERVWFHVASAGEYEQARPIIKALNESKPGVSVFLSFYSPSGYQAFKDHHLVKAVFYLPLDTRRQMKKLVQLVNPDRFILVKYEFWPRLIDVLTKKEIPCYLVSAIFYPGHNLFRPWSRGVLRSLKLFKVLFVQDMASKQLLEDRGFEQVVVAGDTRVDRVVEIVAEEGPDNSDIEKVARFVAKHLVIMGGSTWLPEERMLREWMQCKAYQKKAPSLKMVIAPHDVSESHLEKLLKLFQDEAVRLSDLTDAAFSKAVLIVDQTGILSRLYRYADIAVVGGGFGKGIHNILEPAAYGVPIIFGPTYKKFREAAKLICQNAASSIASQGAFNRQLSAWVQSESHRDSYGQSALAWIESQKGSTALIMKSLLEKS